MDGDRRRALARWALWTALLGAATAGLLLARARLDKAHVALVFLLVVLGGSAAGGRRLGFTLSAAAFLAFNLFFLPPYGTLGIADPLDWLALLAFLTTALVAAQLLDRAQRQAAVARERADELDRLMLERARLEVEAKRAETLREADRLKDALLASVSHDLRTPLTTIKAIAHELLPVVGEPAATIEQEADRLTRFVANMLDLSQLTGGAVAVHVELNAVDDLLGAVIQQTSGIAGDRLVVKLDPGNPLLVGRFDFLHAIRILVNLVDNARKYSAPRQPIELTARRERDRLRFRVADRGPGVPAEEVERIFEPFYRPASRMPDAGGTGLGLSIARRLAELQGGTLTYEARPGGGSVFVLDLPAADLEG